MTHSRENAGIDAVAWESSNALWSVDREQGALHPV